MCKICKKIELLREIREYHNYVQIERFAMTLNKLPHFTGECCVCVCAKTDFLRNVVIVCATSVTTASRRMYVPCAGRICSRCPTESPKYGFTRIVGECIGVRGGIMCDTRVTGKSQGGDRTGLPQSQLRAN